MGECQWECVLQHWWICSDRIEIGEAGLWTLTWLCFLFLATSLLYPFYYWPVRIFFSPLLFTAYKYSAHAFTQSPAYPCYWILWCKFTASGRTSSTALLICFWICRQPSTNHRLGYSVKFVCHLLAFTIHRMLSVAYKISFCKEAGKASTGREKWSLTIYFLYYAQ